MIEIIFDLMKELLKIQIFQRLIVVLLLPNLLVWGFAEVGIDNKYNFLWTHFVGPYWSIEVFLFDVACYGILAISAYGLITFLFKFWGEIQSNEPAPKAHQPNYQSYKEELPRTSQTNPLIVPVRPAPEPPVIPIQVPLTAEEVKRRALRDITGRSA